MLIKGRTYSLCIWARLGAATGPASVTIPIVLWDQSTWGIATSLQAALTRTYTRFCVSPPVFVAVDTPVMFEVQLAAAAATFHLDDFDVAYGQAGVPSPSPVPAAGPVFIPQVATSYETAGCSTCPTEGFWIGISGVAAVADWTSTAAKSTGDRGLSITTSGAMTGNLRDVVLQASPEPRGPGCRAAAATHTCAAPLSYAAIETMAHSLMLLPQPLSARDRPFLCMRCWRTPAWCGALCVLDCRRAPNPNPKAAGLPGTPRLVRDSATTMTPAHCLPSAHWPAPPARRPLPPPPPPARPARHAPATAEPRPHARRGAHLLGLHLSPPGPRLRNLQRDRPGDPVGPVHLGRRAFGADVALGHVRPLLLHAARVRCRQARHVRGAARSGGGYLSPRRLLPLLRDHLLPRRHPIAGPVAVAAALANALALASALALAAVVALARPGPHHHHRNRDLL